MARNPPALGLLAAVMPVVTSAAGNTRFVNFFPDFVDEFTRLRDDQCAALWAIQQTEGAYTNDGNCNELLSCILENTTEAIKANMASGTVALGLAPTILTLLGSTTGETALLSRRRPLLAFLLACGSPAVNPLPTFVYENPLEALKAREGRLAPSHVTAAPPWQSVLIVAVEYLFAAAAIVNIMTVTYYTGKWTINAISCDIIYMPILWVLLAPANHLHGMLALWLRTEVVVDGDRKFQLGWSPEDLRKWLVAHAQHEFTPCARHDKLVLRWKNETYLYVAISWWTSFFNTVHLLYETIAFSSLIFLGVSCYAAPT